METSTLKIVVCDMVNDAPEPLRFAVCEVVPVYSVSYKEEPEHAEYAVEVPSAYVSIDRFPMPSVTLNWPPLMARAPSFNSKPLSISQAAFA